MIKTILVTGKSGQLGSELQEIAKSDAFFTWIFLDRNQLDLSKPAEIMTNLAFYDFDCLINCAAYTAVDKAENEPELADAINHLSVREIAKYTAKHNQKLIHISTDYVFDGTSCKPLKETEICAPINTYGATKRKGETASIENNGNTIIIRTSWVYSSFGANFVKTMSRLLREKETLNVVNDQIGSPTHARDLAEVIVKFITADNWMPGIYHYSNEGSISWHQFVLDIQEILKTNCRVHGIPTNEYPTPAKRPNYSLLDKSKIKKKLGLKIPHYKVSLKQYFKHNLKSLGDFG